MGGSGFWRSGSGIIIRNASKGSKYYTTGSSGFVDVLDVVAVMIALMGSDISNERFVLVSENLTYKELLSALAASFGNPPPTKAFKRSVFIWLCRLDAISSWLFGRKRRLLKSMVKSMYSKSVYSNEKIKRELNFEFRPITQTIERVVRNYSSSS